MSQRDGRGEHADRGGRGRGRGTFLRQDRPLVQSPLSPQLKAYSKVKLTDAFLRFPREGEIRSIASEVDHLTTDGGSPVAAADLHRCAVLDGIVCCTLQSLLKIPDV
jgi:hypothetical protein